MREAQSAELQVWTARPTDFGATLAQDLDWLLDQAERERAGRFKHDADRRSYVLAHALRRLVLARWLGVDPHAIRFSHEPQGRPVLLGPNAGSVHFSHSRCREVVACAVTRVAAVGIDVEPVRTDGADEELIARFVVPDGQYGVGAHERASRFFFQWTALEAFWKAHGQGLADSHPRIECRRDSRGSFEIWLEGDASGPRARLLAIDVARDACITAAICSPAEVEVRLQLFNGNTELFNTPRPHGMLSPS
jgi:4'-phosphopantetheinyl transferase